VQATRPPARVHVRERCESGRIGLTAKGLMARTGTLAVTCRIAQSGCSDGRTALQLGVRWLSLFAMGRRAGVKVG